MGQEVPGLGSLASRQRPRRVERTGVREVDELRERVIDLEARVRALAVSRRVLITLLISSDRRRKLEVTRLKAEVEKLRERNRCYGKALALRRVALHRLRTRLDGLLAPDSAPDTAPDASPDAAPAPEEPTRLP